MTIEEYISKLRRDVADYQKQIDIEKKLKFSVSLKANEAYLADVKQQLEWMEELQRLKATPEDLECEHCRYFDKDETEYPCNQCCRLNSEVDYYESEQN